MVEKADRIDFELNVYWVQHDREDSVALFARCLDRFKLIYLKDMQNGTVGDNTGHSDVET